MNFELQPGKKIEKKEYKEKKPVVSIIVPFYNDGIYINQCINSLLNQTYPYYEILIIDDGSKDEESLKKLKEIELMDSRIKVFHKQNEGLAATRDYGASKSSKDTKYLMFLDSDDVVNKTYLECAYWTLETNPSASWAYSDTVGFESITYLWNKKFNSERMKKRNDLIATSVIRKKDFNLVNGYELREKSVNEDWNFWLKLIAKGKFPVHMSFYGQWYRRKEKGELSKANANKKRALEIINSTAKTITKKVKAIEYPKQDYQYDIIVDKQENIIIPKRVKDNKINILMIIPWMITGGADRFNLELIKRLNKEEFNIFIISTEPSINNWRQEFEEYSTVYDLSTFLDQKNWLSFINYIIIKENINLIFNTNSMYGYSILPYLKANYPKIPILDYVHMEEWYYRNGGYAREAATYMDVIDKTLVCNKGTEKVINEFFKKKKEELETVYIGVDIDKYNPENYNKKDLLKKYKIKDENKIIISYICRIAEQKRPFLLLEIIKEYNKKRDDALFIIAGDGPLLNEMIRQSKNKKISNIIFLGNITSTGEIYAISDITLNCSIKEGLALTTYESLSMGVPVISSNVGGQAELIDDSVGKIVPCLQNEKEIKSFEYKKEEINLYIEALNDVIKRLDNCKKACRNKILKKFTLDIMAKNMTEIFKYYANNPNKEKIENGLYLSKMQNLTKEIIMANLANDTEKYTFQVEVYNNLAYGNYTNKKSKFMLIKKALWHIPLWRKIVQSKVWKKYITERRNN